MATSVSKTKKTTTSASAKKETKEDIQANIENEKLKEQLAEQDKKMQEMQAQMQLLVRSLNGNSAKAEETEKNNRFIKFINLKNSTIVLKGTQIWTIEGRYNYREFPEKEARVIALNMSNYLRKGSVYIADAEFVKDNDLDVIYETLLSDKDLKSLLDKSVNDIIEIYQNANANQKEVIIDYIIDSRKEGKNIDYNILAVLGGMCGKDLINLDED